MVTGPDVGHRMPFRDLPSITKYHNRKPQVLTPVAPDKYSYATVDNPQDFISSLGN